MSANDRASSRNKIHVRNPNGWLPASVRIFLLDNGTFAVADQYITSNTEESPPPG